MKEVKNKKNISYENTKEMYGSSMRFEDPDPFSRRIEALIVKFISFYFISLYSTHK